MLPEAFDVKSAAWYVARGRKNRFDLCDSSDEENAPSSLCFEIDGASKEQRFVSAEWELCVPVVSDGGPLGLIALGPKTTGAAIDDSDETLLSMVAAQLSVALKNGEYLAKIEQQKVRIEALRKRVEAENTSLRAEVRTHSQFSEIIGASTALRDTLDYVARIAPTEATVLVAGETGTGKELVARAIHDLSPRAKGPLISVNCPAIPVDLAESELFGHERGAYTGAVDTFPGKFEMANGGTIFLDEVADLPINVQTKLLRVLQEREVQRLGSHKVRSIDVRIISATNRDLQEEIRRGRFREDLYFRLATVPVYLPSLRERIGDVNMLASFFLDRAATRYQKTIEGISPDAVNVLSAYSWPGNIRELQHVIERAVLLCTSRVLEAEHLSDLVGNDEPLPATLGDAMREEKLRRVREALHATSGNQAAAARLLGMSRSNLARLIKRYGIDPLDFVN
jgi:transcriptional regulator with GAF, ATPase, and Fis domain